MPDDTSVTSIPISDITDRLSISLSRKLQYCLPSTNIKTRALTDANIKAFREKLSLTN